MRHSRLVLLAGALIGTVGAIAILVGQFGARDSSTTRAGVGPGLTPPDQGDAHSGAGPGGAPFRYSSDPPTSGPHRMATVTRDDVELSTDQLLTALELGDVVLVYADPHLTPVLRRLASAQAGPFTPALAATGQAVVLDRRASSAGAPVTAAAWGHLLRARSPANPALTAFVQAWLGRGAPGAPAR